MQDEKLIQEFKKILIERVSSLRMLRTSNIQRWDDWDAGFNTAIVLIEDLILGITLHFQSTQESITPKTDE